jgi:ribonuclease J
MNAKTKAAKAAPDRSLKPGDELLFLPLGGSGEIGMNLNLYGCQGKWVIVDFGMTFADPTLPGIELVFPDIRFLEDNLDNLLGIVLTHGHEDHIGAVPYLAADLGIPIYATPFTAALVREKLNEQGLSGEVKLKTIPMEGSLQLGPFGFRYMALAHSIPEGNALLIETPYGRIFHTGDWKLDEAPILGTPSTAEQLTAVGDAGVLAIVCDSTNVFNAEASGSETGVRDSLMDLLANRPNRVLVTTFASNAARLDTVARVAEATGRRLVLIGRSMERIWRVARETGYLKGLPSPASLDESDSIEPSKQLILCTGCQGEPNAALSRIANGEHSHIKLARGDLVVFSSKQIPGNEVSIGNVINKLIGDGITVIAEKQEHVHVSGHPSRVELEAMYGWIRPKISVPVHGEMRHMTEQAIWAKRWGVPDAIVPHNGTVIRLAPGTPEIIAHAPVGRLVLDGDVIIPHDSLPIIVRRRLMHNGAITAVLALNSKGKLAAEPQVSWNGLPVEDEAEAFEADCLEAIEHAMGKAASGGKAGSSDDERLAEQVRIAVRRVARDYTAKRPVTEVHILRV